MNVYINYDHLMCAFYNGQKLSLSFLGSKELYHTSNGEIINEVFLSLEKEYKNTLAFLEHQNDSNLGIGHYFYVCKEEDKIKQFLLINVADIICMQHIKEILDIYFSNGYIISFTNDTFQYLSLLALYSGIKSLL